MFLKPHKTLMQVLAVAAGYCCTKELLRSNQGVSMQLLADKLGVDVTLLYRTRRRSRLGYIHRCASCPPATADRRLLVPSSPDDSPSGNQGPPRRSSSGS
jgi:hypothetical protein